MKYLRYSVLSIFLFVWGSFSFVSAQPATTVIVSIADQHTYIYEHGQLTHSFVCSTGLLDGDSNTPAGDYILNVSGTKRGTWFYSKTYSEGAKYWVGFIGGVYLFHSVPMDSNQTVIKTEEAKLGQPASHGCIRLRIDDAYWFFKNVPDGSDVHIIKSFTAEKLLENCKNFRGVPVSKDDMGVWFSANGKDYKQRYLLSCEIALIRTVAALNGITGISEDKILSAIPRTGVDPERYFVMDDISAGRKNHDGSIHWNNYGTHPPVVVAELQSLFQNNGMAPYISVREERLTDDQLVSVIKTDQSFRGAIVWVEGHPERWGIHPEVNERGMVAGEHVRFVLPVLTASGLFQIYDPETGKTSSAADAGVARSAFSYRVVTVRSLQ